MKSVISMGRRVAARQLGRLAQAVQPPPPPGPNLTGDRDIEWSWVLAKLGNGPGKALDLGPGPFPLLALTAAQRGYEVLALDIRACTWPFETDSVKCAQADILHEVLPPDTFDLIINCSTIEHIGLPGRFGAEEAMADGDLETMRKLLQALKPSGAMILTLPLGLDAVFAPLHRIYGVNRLPHLLDGWAVREEQYWAKAADNRWRTVSRDTALRHPGSERCYALGCYVLTRRAAT